MKHRELAGILSAPLLTSVIIVVNELVYLEFLYDANFISPLLNSWANYPSGLVTAIFTPDSQVFLCYTGTFQASACYAIYLAWLAVTAGSFVAYLVLYFVVNLNQDAQELAFRSVFYSVMIVAISVVSNYLGLLRGPGSVGPSTAIYASLGMVLGFAVSNSVIWFLSGRTSTGLRQISAIVMGTALAVGLLGFALAEPVDFFNVGPTQKVDATAHMFCFVIGAVTSAVTDLVRLRER